MEFANGKFEIPIPTFGKTGTANRYTNSSFIGYIPGLDRKTGKFEPNEGYVTASYVGYDDNHPMKGKYFTVYGSSGALPLWIETTNIVANSKEYRTGIQAADLAFDLQQMPSENLKNFRAVKISTTSGLPLSDAAKETSSDYIEVAGNVDKRENSITLLRSFEPINSIRSYKAEHMNEKESLNN